MKSSRIVRHSKFEHHIFRPFTKNSILHMIKNAKFRTVTCYESYKVSNNNLLCPLEFYPFNLDLKNILWVLFFFCPIRSYFNWSWVFMKRKFLIYGRFPAVQLHCFTSASSGNRQALLCKIYASPRLHLKTLFSAHIMLRGERNMIFWSLLKFQKKTSSWLPCPPTKVYFKPFS